MYKSLLEKRVWIIVAVQVAAIIGSFVLAFALRFDMKIPENYWSTLWALFPVLLAIKLIVFWKTGLFKGWWRYASMADLIVIFKANLIGSGGFVLYAVYVYRLENIPRSVLALDFIFCFLLMGGVRFVTRAFRENYFPMPLNARPERIRVLVVGAGDAGQMIAREIRQNPRLRSEVVGFLDDDPKKKGERFQGIRVLGRQGNLASVCSKNNVHEVIIAIPSASSREIRRIVERCLEAGVKFKTLPGVGDLIDGRVSVQHIREVNLEDLLGREPARLDVEKIRAYLSGKRVLVTGAGGSIGSEICRQVARFSPGKIILFENAETPLFHIEQELLKNFPDVRLSPIVGDIRYRARVEAIFDEFMPEVVFHAAAYKHVPMMEHNPAEAVNNNVRGTKIIADAANSFGVKNFVMISTDKAVNPTNVMGASKRAAELYIQSLGRRSQTHFVTVRFGNVLGSNGSVVPTFKEQIRKGGPVTVTHPEVTRFFMTIPEASQLVLQAGSMGKGGEIFLLDMGEPVKIIHLAEELIRLSGLRPYEDVDITFTGLRPGEKLYEELLLSGEGTVPTAHEKIMVASAAFYDENVLQQQLEELFERARAMDLAATVGILKEIVPEYRQPVNPSPGKVYLHPAVRQGISMSAETG
ncbi:nucleoside-diphosphate sugar epimerase/dehydratase [Desulfuromonas sp. TF]|uniref:polysaccharide biosynthesis protein n=1 Tax=Desulfuromonas sp. TF TaxID=1232410 RepID=UPI0004109218|nr:nucleoside-diphosphate sugar epimerase/dehydratase [Desulfuromonas sp. TF]